MNVDSDSGMNFTDIESESTALNCQVDIAPIEEITLESMNGKGNFVFTFVLVSKFLDIIFGSQGQKMKLLRFKSIQSMRQVKILGVMMNLWVLINKT